MTDALWLLFGMFCVAPFLRSAINSPKKSALDIAVYIAVSVLIVLWIIHLTTKLPS